MPKTGGCSWNMGDLINEPEGLKGSSHVSARSFQPLGTCVVTSVPPNRQQVSPRRHAKNRISAASGNGDNCFLQPRAFPRKVANLLAGTYARQNGGPPRMVAFLLISQSRTSTVQKQQTLLAAEPSKVPKQP